MSQIATPSDTVYYGRRPLPGPSTSTEPRTAPLRRLYIAALAMVPLVALPTVSRAAEPSELDPVDSVQLGASLERTDEIFEERTASSKTFETNVPGIVQTEVFAAPVHYREGGVWEEIDPTLVAEGEEFVTSAGPVEVAVQSDSSEEIVSLAFGDDLSVGYSLEGASTADADVDGNTAVFEDVIDGVDLNLESLPRGVKETIVLDSLDTPRTFDFPLTLEGLTPQLVDGAVEYVDHAGEPVAITPPGFMIDAAGETSYGVTYELVDDVLRVSLDDAWLRQATFPVEVDPTTVLAGANAWDTYVVQGSPADRSSLTYINTGYTGYNSTRAFLRFPALNSLEGMYAIRAELRLWQANAGSCAGGITGVYPVAASWTPSTTTNWPGPALIPVPDGSTRLDTSVGWFEEGTGASPSCSPGYVTADVTAGVQQVLRPDIPNYGFAMVNENQSAYAEFKQWSTTESAHPPSMTVEYAEISTDASNAPELFVTGPEGTLTPGAIELTAEYFDPNGDPGSITFAIQDGATNETQYVTSGTVASGGTVSVPVTLDPSDYYVTASATDGTGVTGMRGELSAVFDIAEVGLTGTAENSALTVVSGVEELTAESAVGTDVSYAVDGASIATEQAGESVDWNTAGLSDGYHELTVASGNEEQVYDVVVDNTDHVPAVDAADLNLEFIDEPLVGPPDAQVYNTTTESYQAMPAEAATPYEGETVTWIEADGSIVSGFVDPDAEELLVPEEAVAVVPALGRTRADYHFWDVTPPSLPDEEPDHACVYRRPPNGPRLRLGYPGNRRTDHLAPPSIGDGLSWARWYLYEYVDIACHDVNLENGSVVGHDVNQLGIRTRFMSIRPIAEATYSVFSYAGFPVYESNWTGTEIRDSRRVRFRIYPLLNYCNRPPPSVSNRVPPNERWYLMEKHISLQSWSIQRFYNYFPPAIRSRGLRCGKQEGVNWDAPSPRTHGFGAERTSQWNSVDWTRRNGGGSGRRLVPAGGSWPASDPPV